MWPKQISIQKYNYVLVSQTNLKKAILCEQKHDQVDISTWFYASLTIHLGNWAQATSISLQTNPTKCLGHGQAINVQLLKISTPKIFLLTWRSYVW